jgi:hypothetical protein
LRESVGRQAGAESAQHHGAQHFTMKHIPISSGEDGEAFIEKAMNVGSIDY